MKKNILIISSVFPPEPVVSAKLSEDIAICLSKKHNVTVIAPIPTRPYGFKLSPTKKKKPYTLKNLNSYTCPEFNFFGRIIESYSFGQASSSFIKKSKDKFDLIYMNSWPIFSQYLIVKVASKYNIPVITHVQDIYPESLSNKVPIFGFILNFLFMPIDKIILEKSKKVLAISAKMKNYLSKSRKISLDKINVVQNWQNEDTFINYNKSKIVTENKYFSFMYMGNIGPVSGVDLLIESFYKLNLKKCKLIIAGSGTKKKELENLVSFRNIKRVEFVDVADGMVPHIQAAADVMLLPIKKGAASSSIPSKLPAYMFSKKPIIASIDKDSDTANIISISKAGWIIEPENKQQLTNKMREAFFSDSLDLKIKGENGFNYAIKNLSKKNNLIRVIDLISKTLYENK